MVTTQLDKELSDEDWSQTPLKSGHGYYSNPNVTKEQLDKAFSTVEWNIEEENDD